MDTKNCMWCLKEYQLKTDEKFCSEECESKNKQKPKDNIKKGIIGVFADLTSSLFS